MSKCHWVLTRGVAGEITKGISVYGWTFVDTPSCSILDSAPTRLATSDSGKRDPPVTDGAITLWLRKPRDR